MMSFGSLSLKIDGHRKGINEEKKKEEKLKAVIQVIDPEILKKLLAEKGIK